MPFLVSDFMTRQVVTVRPGDRLRQAAERMQARGCRRLPVVEDHRWVGIISDRDVRLALASPLVMRERGYDDKLLDETPVRACMSPQVETVSPDTPLIQAAMLMRDNKVGGLPVVARDRLTGIITETDMLNALIQVLIAEPASPPTER